MVHREVYAICALCTTIRKILSLQACNLLTGFLELFQGNNLRPLTIGMSLMLLQQITGQPSVLYYAVRCS